ncbi:MAG: CBS domain-containing protein [Candidatus Azobacteroides sp.]|nr:CBS domain-containing protein [Candidatus Azobacteroides sp.]
MLSKEILIKQIPAIRSTDKGSLALSLMEEYRVKHLPVVDDGKYTCLLTEKDIFLMEDIEDQVKGICFFTPYVGKETHILEVLRIMSNDKLTLLPVVDPEGRFVGGITLQNLVEKLSEITNAGSNGALIAIEIYQQDYDLSNIIRLVESNNSKVLSFFTYCEEDIAGLNLLLKIDSKDASAVLRSFERFNYHVTYCLQKQSLAEDIQRKRLDELMHYLQM